MRKYERRHTLKIFSIIAGIAVSIALSLFAVSQYKMSTVLAEENLRGLALSLSAAIETISAKDPTFSTLRDFQTDDIAYFAIIDRNGTILFHTNSALIGQKLEDRRFAPVFDNSKFSGKRVMLGTGETIYESNFPLHMQGKTLALRLALHTYRADSVIRKAQIGTIVIFSLIAAAWGMAFLLMKYSLREETHKREMMQRREMARLGEMGSVIAHEIRNPLAGIKGYAQLLQERPGTEEDRQAAELIVREAVRLEEIVSGLLAYTQVGTTSPELVRIHDVATRALAVVSSETVMSGVSIECSLDDTLCINGNPNRIEQLFLNLIRNALQAMPNGGKLAIVGQQLRNSIEILVTDTGQGIDRENIGRIFEPFFTTKARGTGLGLSVCRKIIDEHNGEIAVESSPGNGTTFRITFPVPLQPAGTRESNQ